MVHELRKDRQFRGEVERRWVVLAEVGKLGDQPDEHTVDPTQDIQRVLILTLEDGVPGHEHCSRLLVKTRGNVAHVRVSVPVRDGRHSEALSPRGVQVACLELQVALLPLWQGVCRLVRHVKVEADGCVLVQGAHHPLAGAALADLGLGDAWALLAKGRQAANRSAALELAGSEDLDLCVEAQLQVSRLVAVENLAEGVLEDVHAEGVAHDHETPRLVRDHLHLIEAHLVQGAREDVHGEAGGHRARGQGRVELQRLLRVLRIRSVFLEVQM
mmetsp:Transcript_83087/g.257933  ORF Transcript_83087/g.257933 Transcript_83087/m.257933 type:complete len:272 (-) Transcript_83087:699-1514(-)